ncbi:hypothetical protein L6Q79_10370 [bacterium]|nr:hypothetical protein [bacterium]NUN45936.1 hypothetical protein [bacterium]
MKHLLSFIAIVLMSMGQISYAQDKGNLLISGAFSYNVSETIPEELSFLGENFSGGVYQYENSFDAARRCFYHAEHGIRHWYRLSKHKS